MPDCIEFCVANPPATDRERLRESEAVEQPCLGRCGRCRRERFLVVDGEPVTVTDADPAAPLAAAAPSGSDGDADGGRR